MAEKLHLPRKRWVQSGWLLAILIAATTLFSFASGSPKTASSQPSVRQPTISVAITQVISSAPKAISAPIRESRFATRSIPLQLIIPSISVNSKIMQLGLEKDGSLAVPPDGSLAGWYKGSPTPGEIGPSVIVAHVDWKGKLGVFYYLKNIKVGAIVKVRRADGLIQSFKVERVAYFDKKNFPSHQVYGDVAYSGLRLITCESFDFKIRKYVQNLVVFAKAIN